MRRFLYYTTALIATLLFSSGSVLVAAQIVGPTTVSPAAITVDTPTQITITVTIVDTTVIPQSIRLQRINGDGSISILGVLHDDGLNGDAALGDRIYSIVTGLNESTAGTLDFRISAAFRGMLRRVASEMFSIAVQESSTPEQMLNQLASELAAGDIEAALQHFSSSPLNRQVLENLSPVQRNALATAFTSAQLVKTDGRTRVYLVPWKNDSGGDLQIRVGLVQADTGEWSIMNW